MTSRETVGIGAAARLLGTTERALRYYQQRGLMPPVEVSISGHRRYNELALRHARRVLALRKLGLSLSTVGKLLDGDGADDITTVLTEQAQRLDAELNELGALRNRITELLAAATPTNNTDEALDLLEDLAMKIVLTRIYTRTGDDGTTALAGGTRVDKTDARLEVMGDVDELVSALGVALAASSGQHATLLRSVQNDLFDLGADIAATGIPRATNSPEPLVDATYVDRLEKACDETNARLDPPASFVLPGSNPCSAAIHQARAICRRAERHSWAARAMADDGRHYLNRLSDLLFILARATETKPEPTWAPRTHHPS
jgi:cob(I)alamin adenosyltransferase